MILEHIDNSFYKLTPAQAKALSFEGSLPRCGYALRANPAKLGDVQLSHRGEILSTRADKAEQAWIQRTPLNGEQVLALHLYFSPF
jgi:hypothetical protein